ncbi:hypothetical protein X777_09816 [Ooceraea biroi]|nr:hypothetical protein X777_09816 [Ooceraea biroi]
MDTLELKIGTHCKEYADSYDATRIRQQERQSLSSSKEARTARKELNLQQQQLYEDAEGLLYGPGIAD